MLTNCHQAFKTATVECSLTTRTWDTVKKCAAA